MKSFHCQANSVKIVMIGEERKEFEPNRPYVEAVVKMKVRRERSRAIREQNRLGRTT